MGKRGETDDATRHLGCAGAWELFPNKDAVFINYNGHLPADKCHTATYQVPENNAFWFITIYGVDGYMKTVNNILNAANAKMNADGTFTVYFGSKVGTSSCACIAPVHPSSMAATKCRMPSPAPYADQRS